MAMLDAPAPVNLVRSLFLCNIFNFFFAASKACLIPFLAIFLKKLGLSASHAGIIIGTKTLVGMVFAPLWAKCAVRCGRRRCVLMFSLFVMAAAYMSLTAVPSIDENVFKTQHCGNKEIVPVPPLNLSNIPENEGHKVPETSNVTTTTSSSVNITGSTVNTTAETPGNGSTKNMIGKPDGHNIFDQTPGTSPAPEQTTTEPAESETESDKNADIRELLTALLVQAGADKSKVEEMSTSQLINDVNGLLKTPQGEKILAEALDKLPLETSMKLADAIESRKKRAKRQTNTSDSTEKIGVDNSWKAWIVKEIKDVRKQIRETEDQVFAVVLIILMVGEVFAAPIEKIADDGWYEFLESIDDIEKYGMQRVWSSFAYIVFPVIVTLAVDNTSCLFGTVIHPFMLHFYMSGLLLAITLLLAFCYPMTTSEKYKYASKVMKGVQTICCNGRSFIFMVTLILMGMVYSSYYNFLFWMLLDMGSREVTFGLCLMLAALSEIPMLLFNGKLVEKIGNGGVVCLSVLFLSARCLYYSFLTSPWAVLPAEITHAFTHTAMWWAVLSSSQFNTSPALGRSIRSILSTAYFGVGFAVGSFLSGFVYEIYGSKVLFQAGSIMAIAWLPILGIGMCCCRERDRMEIKYTKLLSSEDASEDSDAMEDDWLEQALKDK